MEFKFLRYNLFFCFLSLVTTSFSINYSEYVDPFIGTKGGGNVFPGVSYPFGMVKLGPDCGEMGTNMGYASEGKVRGFSHTHVSGTGGGPKYGNILVYPFVGEVKIRNYGSDRGKEIAKVGYYSTELIESNILSELTCTPKTGIHKYTFNETNAIKGILIDAGSFLGKNHCCFEAQKLVGSEIEILSDTEIAGYSRVKGGWNMGRAYTVYFYAKFDTPAKKYGTWKSETKNADIKTQYDSGEPVGAWFIFDSENKEIGVKVGISFISIGKAKINFENEAKNIGFQEAITLAEQEWNRYLEKIDITTNNEVEKIKFYSALYRSLLQPTDRTTENPLWKSALPYYDDYYAIWDTYRTIHPLFNLIIPQKQVDMINSMIDIYDNEGYLPDGRSGNDNGRTQGGSNGDMVIAEAILKNIKGFDYEKAYLAMLKNAEVPPAGEGRKEGRGGLEDYKTLGYVSTDFERAGTRTVEYSANDWSIALVAKRIGKEDEYEKYKKRASNWINLWKDIEYDGARGFIMPKKSDGTWDENYKETSWKYFTDITANEAEINRYKKSIPSEYFLNNTYSTLTGGGWNNFFYESHSWEYSLYVPHDVRMLIEKSGGKQNFIKRLDTFFEKKYFNITNEPGFLSPCLYIYAGQYAKTAKLIRKLLSENYTEKTDGLPGNDDSGAMSSWYLFHKIGFFPNAGQDVYLLTTPHFEKTKIDLGNGKHLEIIAKNVSDKNIYITSAQLNGKPLNKNWFRHSDIENGGVLKLTMGNNANLWEVNSPPPSLSDNN